MIANYQLNVPLRVSSTDAKRNFRILMVIVQDTRIEQSRPSSPSVLIWHLLEIDFPVRFHWNFISKSLNYEITKISSEELKREKELADTQHTLFDETVHEIDENKKTAKCSSNLFSSLS